MPDEEEVVDQLEVEEAPKVVHGIDDVTERLIKTYKGRMEDVSGLVEGYLRGRREVGRGAAGRGELGANSVGCPLALSQPAQQLKLRFHKRGGVKQNVEWLNSDIGISVLEMYKAETGTDLYIPPVTKRAYEAQARQEGDSRQEGVKGFSLSHAVLCS